MSKRRKISPDSFSQGKKRPIKGRKSLRGQPENQFNEPKQQASFSLTRTAKENLEELRILYGCASRSEFLELIARQLIKLESADSFKPL